MFKIFQRVNDIVNANINDMLDRIEDPERMIKQLIREMEENIIQAKEGVINAIASEKQLLKELESQRHQSASWLQKAQRALETANEELARAALVRKKEIDNIIDGLEPAWLNAKTTSNRLKTQLQKLEAKLDEVKQKRSALIARQHAAQARQQMSKTMERFQEGLDTHTQFSRMEDRIEEMEARTAAIAELEDDASALEKEFLELEIHQDVEMELAALKLKVQKK